MNRGSYINTRDKHNPMIVLEIDGYNYGFSIIGFPEESYDWLVGVLERQMQQIHNRATDKAKEEIQGEFKKLLGL